MLSAGTKQDSQVKDEDVVKHPKLYRVLLHNDHYTTMDFVVYILQDIFNKPHDEAVTIMLKVHREGVGVAGVYVRTVAEAKVETVHKIAKENGFPLRCSISPE
ncbi:MAG TPA: ATP-dependent Clp protease adaptor ClpS [Candidatus Hydrogenedens sp.]|nr:ATP-dependent Clp protease adaptor ClpS [Candidatus Hydrogenedens sp.]